jgi:hypothetical protein
LTSPPSYLDTLFSALRAAGQALVEAESWLSRAEERPAFRLQALAAAGRAHEAARAQMADVEAQLQSLGADNLPVLLDQIPSRLSTLRAELRASEQRLLRAAELAASSPIGKA